MKTNSLLFIAACLLFPISMGTILFFAAPLGIAAAACVTVIAAVRALLRRRRAKNPNAGDARRSAEVFIRAGRGF